MILKNRFRLMKKPAFLFFSILFFLSGCGNLSKSTPEISVGVATAQDRQVLSALSNKEFDLVPSEDSQWLYVDSVARVTSMLLDFPNVLSFNKKQYAVTFDAQKSAHSLVYQDNAVYDERWGLFFVNGDYSFAMSSGAGSSNQYKRIQSTKMGSALTAFESLMRESTLNTDVTTDGNGNTLNYTVNSILSSNQISGNITLTSTNQNVEIAKFTIQNGTVINTAMSIYTNSSVFPSHATTVFVSCPYTLLASGHSYQGTFSSDSLTIQDKETYQAVANLVSLDSGKNIGEARITTGNILKIYVRNESGGLEALVPPGN